MALLFMDGFDAGDYQKKWPVQIINGATPALSTTTRFNTGKSLNTPGGHTGGWCGMQRSFAPSTQVFFGTAFMMSTVLSNRSMVILSGDSGATAHLSLSFNGGGVLTLYRGDYGTLLSTASVSLGSNIWNYIEITATIADAGGICQVRLNGNLAIDYTGDTKNGGTNSTFDVVTLQAAQTTYGTNYYWDDVYVCNSTGATNNTFLGDVRVQTIVPTAAGASTQFTPTGGANYANVAESPDSTATYNSSSTVGERDTYVMSDLASGTTSVYGIQDNIAAWKADAGTGNIKAALKVGSTVYYDPTVSLGTSAGVWNGAVRETNPATSTAWTPSEVNDIEFGAEVA